MNHLARLALLVGLAVVAVVSGCTLGMTPP